MTWTPEPGSVVWQLKFLGPQHRMQRPTGYVIPWVSAVQSVWMWLWYVSLWKNTGLERMQHPGPMILKWLLLVKKPIVRKLLALHLWCLTSCGRLLVSEGLPFRTITDRVGWLIALVCLMQPWKPLPIVTMVKHNVALNEPWTKVTSPLVVATACHLPTFAWNGKSGMGVVGGILCVQGWLALVWKAVRRALCICQPPVNAVKDWHSCNKLNCQKRYL